jgi:hypothetical protein
MKQYDINDEVRRALIIPDCHIPYHDNTAYSLMLRVAEMAAVSEIVILGDYADFYSVSSHAKDPNFSSALSDELDHVNAYLDELDERFPTASKVYIEGNHEHRLQRFINSRAPELNGLTRVESLLRLDTRDNWSFINYEPSQLYSVLGSKLFARHEPYAGSTHRIQESQIVYASGENHRGISCGWLGDVTSSVFNYVPSLHQWAHGFSIVDVLPDGTFFNNMIHIIDGKCSYGGVIIDMDDDGTDYILLDT